MPRRADRAARRLQLARRSPGRHVSAGGAATGELIDAITRARQLRELHGDASNVIDALESTARQQEHDRRALEADAQKWKGRSSLLQDKSVPPSIRERAESMETKLQATGARIGENQYAVLAALDRAVAVRVRIDDASTLEVGTVSIAANSIVTALGVAIATVVLTGLTGFLLDREVVPRLQLRPGAGFAMITFTRWAIVIIGATLTLAALGIDMAKIALMAWVPTVDVGLQAQNALRVAIIRKLGAAGIGIPFPARDPHIEEARAVEQKAAA